MGTDTRERFVARALQRKPLFLVLSVVGVAIAWVLAAYYGYRRLQDPTYPLGAPAVIVVLVLLNSRHNLRQYRFASALEAYKSTGV